MKNSYSNTEKTRKNFIIPEREKYSLADFYWMKNQEVIETFAALPRAENVGKGDQQFVYIPGTREDRVLLCSHSDTSDGDIDVELAFDTELGEYFSRGKHAIGADDRSGVKMLWELRNSGHSILLPNAEESGCIGAGFLMESSEWRDEINKHQWAIEFDRKDSSDLVFYQVGTPEFKNWCEDQFDGYKRSEGSFTDICKICSTYRHKKDCLPGVNISIGYYGQHGSSECQNLSEWNRTLLKTHQVLSKENIPKFLQKYEVQEYTQNIYSGSGFQNRNHSVVVSDRRSRTFDSSQVLPAQYQEKDNEGEFNLSVLVCPYCEGIFDEYEYARNKECCLYCEKSF